MGWIPPPRNIRTRQVFSIDEKPYVIFEYSNHVINDYGVLASFKVKNTSLDPVEEATINNESSCLIR